MGKLVRLEPEEHKYTNPLGEVYTSVSKVIEICKNPFDQLEIATKYAAKHGGTAEGWIAKWDAKTDFSQRRGNAFHQFKEGVHYGQGFGVFGDRVFDVQNYNIFDEQGKDLINYPDGIYLELPLSHEGFMIAGTPDKFLIDTIDGVRYIDIDDYKTNHTINLVSYLYSRSGNYKMMLYPMHDLMDCNYVHYSLQLSIYAYMLECLGFVPRKLRILHYEYDNLTSTDPKDAKVENIYEINYQTMKPHVIRLLNHHYELRREEKLV